MPLTFSHSSVLLGITSKWFNDPVSSDLEVRLKNDKVLHCHRLVLRSWSEVWAAALEDKKETSLDLTVHDPAIVEMCVRYCYTATIDIDITDDDLTLRVHLFAHQYNLKELATACEQRLTQLVTSEDDVLDACCRWLAGSPNTAAVNDDPQVLQRAERVLQLVRFPMLSAMKLLEFKSHPMMVRQSETLLRRHHFALEWVMINRFRPGTSANQAERGEQD